jgi:hypothetical protein
MRSANSTSAARFWATSQACASLRSVYARGERGWGTVAQVSASCCAIVHGRHGHPNGRSFRRQSPEDGVDQTEGRRA